MLTVRIPSARSAEHPRNSTLRPASPRPLRRAIPRQSLACHGDATSSPGLQLGVCGLGSWFEERFGNSTVYCSLNDKTIRMKIPLENWTPWVTSFTVIQSRLDSSLGYLCPLLLIHSNRIINIIIYFAQTNKLTVKIQLHEQVRQGWGQLL